MDKQRKLQKFSIRKYTVGTCSILIGTLIFLGLPTHDAFASENVIQKHAQEEKAEGKSTDPVEEAAAIEETTSTEEAAKEIGTAETPAEQPQEEATTEAPAVDETTQDATTNEESTTEDKSTTEEASTVEATQVDTVAPETAKVETAEKAKQPQAEATEVAKEESSTEEATETAEPAVNTVDAVQPASVEKTTPAVDTPTVEATVTNTISDVDTNSVSSKSLEDIVNNQNKDKVDATTLEQPSRQAPKSGESYGSVFRAAELQTRHVSNFDQFSAALKDKNVGKIIFDQDIELPKAYKVLGTNQGLKSTTLTPDLARAVEIDLNSHILNTRDNYIVIEAKKKNQPNWNITFSNGHIHCDDNQPGPGRENAGIIQFKDGHDQVLNFRDIEHKGSTLTNDYYLTVNISGNFSSTNLSQRGWGNNTNIGAQIVRIADGSNVNMSMTGEGNLFKIYPNGNQPERNKMNGILAFGSNCTINLEAFEPDLYSYGNNSQKVLYVDGGGARITFGNNNNIKLKGQDIFSFKGDNAMIDFGVDNIVKVEQRGNGQVIDLQDNADFHLGRGTQFIATSFGKIAQGTNPRENTLVRMQANNHLIVDEDATFKLDAINHLRNPKTGKVHSHNTLFVMEGWSSTESYILLKNNSTFDICTDNTDFDHSEVLGMPNRPGTDTKLIIDGTAKYVNIQRNAATRHPDWNTAHFYGNNKAIITWSGDHRLMTWNATKNPGSLSDKNNNYADLSADIPNKPNDVWDNLNNYTARYNEHSLKFEKLGNPNDPDAINRNTTESNRDKEESKRTEIEKMTFGNITRFVLIGHDASVNAIDKRRTVYTAIQDEAQELGNQTTTQEGRDGEGTKFTSRVTDSEGNPNVRYSYNRGDDKNLITPIEKHVEVNTLKKEENDVAYETIYEADPEKLITEDNEEIQAGENGREKVLTVYKLNEETGEIIETVETDEDGTQTNPIVTKETLKAKQDRIVKVGAKEVITDVVVPYETEKIPDSDLEVGKEIVDQDGVDGTKEVIKIYNIDSATGERTTVASTSEHETKPATKKIVRYGTKPHADANDPNYGNEPVPTKPGKAVDVPQTGDTDLPPGTTYEIPEGADIPEGWTASVDPNTGVVTVTPPADATPGTTADIPVEVTYPDGTKDTATAKVTVVPNEAQNNDPNYGNEPVPTKPGKAVDVPQTGDTDLPPGTTYEIPEGSVPEGWTATVDSNTGVVTVTPPANATSGDNADIPVKVKYPDGSSDDTTVPVKVEANDAQNNEPNYANEPVPTKPGKAVDVPQTGDT
ncbi:YPDG domain-containing protein, partial [Mammaliicoccus sciuri]|uniref:YPDG domain-containing protein n=1 Tax=Mammaliicoccus sciuri TaxID=1296 RepID=UPI001FB1EE9D